MCRKEDLVDRHDYTIELDAVTVTNRSNIKEESKIEGFSAASFTRVSVGVLVDTYD